MLLNQLQNERKLIIYADVGRMVKQLGYES